MAIKEHHVDLDLNQNQLLRAVLELVGADPTAIAGQVWFRTDEDRVGVETSTGVEKVAYLSDLEAFGALVGTHDASTGIPTVGSGDGGAIRAGDYWVVSADGTILGVGGSDALTSGDILIATADGAAAAADFTGVEQNIDLGGVSFSQAIPGLALPANTPTVIVTSPVLARLDSIQVFDNTTKDEIEVRVNTTTNGAPVLESNQALTVEVRVVGVV